MAPANVEENNTIYYVSLISIQDETAGFNRRESERMSAETKNAFPEEGKDRICSDHGYKGRVKTERIRLVIEFGIKDRLVGSVPVKVIDDEDVVFVFDAQ